MQLPILFLDSIKDAKGFVREEFDAIHNSSERITSIRINPTKFINSNSPFPITQNIPWTQFGYYLPSRPSFTFDPLFHSGSYYVQEASSMFLEQVFLQLVDVSKSLKVLDLCAAPGGKSTHILSLISKNSLLVCNEVIRSRVNSLNENIVKWGCDNVVVTNNDAKDFQHLENYFDVIVVDAPCSGSGLFRRDEAAIEEWSLNNVNLCSGRQQRIVADILPFLKENGILIYSTCSYSREEDEEICKWVEREFQMKHEELKIKDEWGIVSSDYGYRFWPNRLKGEGFFLACFRKTERESNSKFKSIANKHKSIKIKSEQFHKWVKDKDFEFLEYQKNNYAVNKELFCDIYFLLSKLRVINFGVNVGVVIRDKYIPSHELAMSDILSKDVPSIELDYNQSIQFLKKKELQISTTGIGFQLAKYKNQNLGWLNVLSNRINNYYPKGLRIRKD